MRSGDDIYLPSRIQNLTEDTQRVRYHLEIEDVAGKLLNEWVTMDEESLDLAPNSGIQQNARLKIPSNFVGQIIIRYLAVGEDYSDGEEHLVNVLPNRSQVSESEMIYVEGGGSKEFVFENLEKHAADPSRDNKLLQMQITEHPLWFAIQAMPYINGVDPRLPENLAHQLFVNGNCLASDGKTSKDSRRSQVIP